MRLLLGLAIGAVVVRAAAVAAPVRRAGYAGAGAVLVAAPAPRPDDDAARRNAPADDERVPLAGVVRFEDGAPADEAWVTFGTYDGVISDRAGRFRFPRVALVRANLIVLVPGYEEYRRTIAPGRTDVEVVLRQSHVVRGRVVASGRGVPNAQVRRPAKWPSEVRIRLAETDDDGSFQLRLPSGRHELIATDGARRSFPVVFELGHRRAAPDLELVLARSIPSSTVTVAVRDASAAPLPNVDVDWSLPVFRPRAAPVTDFRSGGGARSGPDGTRRLDLPLPAGTDIMVWAYSGDESSWFEPRLVRTAAQPGASTVVLVERPIALHRSRDRPPVLMENHERRRVHGRVTDAHGRPLGGVGIANQLLSRPDGSFRGAVWSSGSLRITREGFATRTVAAVEDLGTIQLERAGSLRLRTEFPRRWHAGAWRVRIRGPDGTTVRYPMRGTRDRFHLLASINWWGRRSTLMPDRTLRGRAQGLLDDLAPGPIDVAFVHDGYEQTRRVVIVAGETVEAVFDGE